MLKPWILAAIAICLPLTLNLQSYAGDKKKTEQLKKTDPIVSKDDELNAKDPRDTHQTLKKSPRKTYAVTLAKDKVYQIDLKSKDFDAIARLEDSKGKQVAFNDDSPVAKGTDARILFRPAETSEFTVVATNRDGKAGKFSLAVTERPDLKNASIYPALSIAMPISVETKDRKVNHVDRFHEMDGLVFSKHYKAYSIKLDKGQTYRIELKSGDFDAFLVLEDPNGNIIAQDDDSGGGINAGINFTPEVAGTYRIIATSATARRVGGFELFGAGPK